MIEETLIQAKIENRVSVFTCVNCNTYFALVLFDKDENGEPVQGIIYPDFCPLCGECSHQDVKEIIEILLSKKREVACLDKLSYEEMIRLTQLNEILEKVGV